MKSKSSNYKIPYEQVNLKNTSFWQKPIPTTCIYTTNNHLILTIVTHLTNSICGLAFVLYVLRLSGLNGFWKKLGNTDAATYKLAISYQKILQKYIKPTLDVYFLKKCKSSTTYPKFLRWKNTKNKQLNDKNRQYHAWHTNEQVTSHELRVNVLTSYVYCTSYELLIIFIARVTI